jgi:hypothetical protein
VYNFIYGALFSINKKNILKNDISIYHNINAELLKYDQQGGMEGYILERAWHTIFDYYDFSYNTKLEFDQQISDLKQEIINLKQEIIELKKK